MQGTYHNPPEQLKFLFLVQGEGRGHMTQAIELSALLEKAGHRVVQVCLGVNARRKVPHFFKEQVRAEKLELLPSPGFETDQKNRSINIAATIGLGLFRIRRYLKSLQRLHHLVRAEQPDVFVNFYDLLGGIYHACYRHHHTYICIGHQYLANHPSFPVTRGTINRWLFLLHNKVTVIKAKRILALSFRQYPPLASKSRTEIVPPIIRTEIKEGATSTGNYLLVYLLNNGYTHEIISWHQLNSQIKIHCFVDDPGKFHYYKHPNLTLHTIDYRQFTFYMQNCLGYVTTAGFESVCEAMYLGKPVMTVPVEDHYEQACNAQDAILAGAGITGPQFDLGAFLDYCRQFEAVNNSFREWTGRAEEMQLEAMTTSRFASASREKDPLVGAS